MLPISTLPSVWLQRLAAPDTLYQAWRKVRANRGAAGVDAVSVVAYERDLKPNLADLGRSLLTRSYEPLPLRAVTIPKKDGLPRELAIPCVRDRIAQRALLDLIEPVFEGRFLDSSFAFRPGRSTATAIQRVLTARAQGYMWTVHTDIHDFFPSIDHHLLLDEFTTVMDDIDVLRLIKQWLAAGVLEHTPSPGLSLLGQCRMATANLNLMVFEAIESVVEGFVSERIGNPVTASPLLLSDSTDPVIDLDPPGMNSEVPETPSRRRIIMRRLLENGILLALTERALAKRLLTMPALGIGGAVLTGAFLLPKLLEKLEQSHPPETGAPQGSPLSPFLSNVHLHPFDVALREANVRLVRYCDDFLLVCRTRQEATQVFRTARHQLLKRGLKVNSEKTQLLGPNEPVQFLGYEMLPNGGLIPPPHTSQIVLERIQAAVQQTAGEAKAQAQSVSATTRRGLARVLTDLARRLDSSGG
ncbi:MAG: hypothetical protein K1Y36_30930 [Blastocatellia bacterium]|nr:hypothetical protein [Blastocatellia bacterium]